MAQATLIPYERWQYSHHDMCGKPLKPQFDLSDKKCHY